MKQTDSQTRLSSLLRELLQLDVADLDFGLYRLFRLKRGEVEAFLEKQLPAEVDRAFEAAASAEREALQKRVDDLAERALATVADDAILPSGEPNPAHAQAKAVREYTEARQRLQAVEVSEAQRAEVFNLLYAFFSRYYDEGDFIPRRFYGARPAYAVAYNGEEVFFHWANKDQYYVKTGEAFRDYAFEVSTVRGLYRVRFTLAEATAPKDNTKGDTRFFFPLAKQALFDEATRTFSVPFHYRLPTEAEVSKYGKNAKAQEAILDEAAPRILGAVTGEFLRAALAAPSPGRSLAEGEEPPTLLRRRLRHFTKKNTTDYFVHKDLGAFLCQELEFFVRDQVVHEADLEGDFDAKRRTIRVFRKLAETLITFLAQIEDAQKRLFEKKKFVLRTDYLVPIQNVPRALWPEVIANKVQMAEWKKLYALEPKSDLFNTKGKVNERVLEEHPTLVVDTQHFDAGFAARLLEGLADLEEQTDGLLVHSENFQALNLLLERYREQAKCIYIDPPYNTGSDNDFAYKDNYQHGSWLSMMVDRAALARALSASSSGIFVSTDDGEYANLRLAFGQVWGDDNLVADIIWNSRKSVSSDALISGATNHTTFFAANRIVLEKQKTSFRLPQDEEGFASPDDDPRGPWKLDPMDAPNIRENLTYPIRNPLTGEEHYPPEGRCWRFERRQTEQLLIEGRIVFGRTGTAKPMYKRFLSEAKEKGRTPTTLWDDVKTTTDATRLLLDVFGSGISRELINRIKPKPHELVERCVVLLTDGAGY
jgi:adenine-specific DNA-methyltransferase